MLHKGFFQLLDRLLKGIRALGCRALQHNVTAILQILQLRFTVRFVGHQSLQTNPKLNYYRPTMSFRNRKIYFRGTFQLSAVKI